MAMLEAEPALTLELLNQATQAWVEQEYHRSVHSEIGTTPLERYLAGPNVARQCPGTAALAQAFRIEVTRRQRRSDGTVSLAGQRFEIPAQYRQLANVQLRYARWYLRRVDLFDARTGVGLCCGHPLDRSAHIWPPTSGPGREAGVDGGFALHGAVERTWLRARDAGRLWL